MKRYLSISLLSFALLGLIGELSGCSSRNESAATSKPLFVLASNYPKNAIFSPDGKTIISTDGKECFFWSTEPSNELKKPFHTLPSCDFDSLKFSKDGKLFITDFMGSHKKLWSTDPKEQGSVDLSTAEGNECDDLQVSPDFKTVACALWNRSSEQLFRIGNDFKLQPIGIFPNSFRGVFSPDSQYFVTSEYNCEPTLRFWKNEGKNDSKPLATLNPKLDNCGTVNSLSFTPDNENLVAVTYAFEGSELIFVKARPIEKPALMAKFNLPNYSRMPYTFAPLYDYLPAILISPDSKTLAIKDWTASKPLNFLNLEPAARLPDPIAYGVEQAVFSPDAQTLAARSGHNLKLFKNKPSADLRPYVTILLRMGFSKMIFSPNSHYLAIADDIVDKVDIWKNEPSLHPIPIATFKGRKALAFSPDSKMILIGGPFPSDQIEAWPIPTEGSTK